MSKKKLCKERNRKDELSDRVDELSKEQEVLRRKTKAELAYLSTRRATGLKAIDDEWKKLDRELYSLKPHYVEKFERVLEINERVNQLREEWAELNLQLCKKSFRAVERHYLRNRAIYAERRKLVGEYFEIEKQSVLAQRMLKDGVRNEGRHS